MHKLTKFLIAMLFVLPAICLADDTIPSFPVKIVSYLGDQPHGKPYIVIKDCMQNESTFTIDNPGNSLDITQQLVIAACNAPRNPTVDVYAIDQDTYKTIYVGEFYFDARNNRIAMISYDHSTKYQLKADYTNQVGLY